VPLGVIFLGAAKRAVIPAKAGIQRFAEQGLDRPHSRTMTAEI
jgi:hypothetical protein